MNWLARSVVPSSDQLENIRAYTRQDEFDFTSWTLDAAWTKFSQGISGEESALSPAAAHDLVITYLSQVYGYQVVTQTLEQIYSDPAIHDPTAASAELRSEQHQLSADIKQSAPAAEAVLQDQITSVLYNQGLSSLGNPLPPVLFHFSPLPFALIISPRNIIRQDAYISLQTDLSITDRVALERAVETGQGVSALVEEIGGIGTYPTMVQQGSDLNWLVEVIAHEWIHNYLEWHPLGLGYDSSPEMRTMNETAASIAGKEISALVIARYYPELVPPAVDTAPARIEPNSLPPEPAFDFRAEMRDTRVKVDQLLAAGKVTEAETYMEERRQFFWQNGYQIRRLNQAYFAFHGAYADTPGGAAGADPVGPAVRELRRKSPTLAAFIHQIAALSSFEELQQLLH
jgi:hypothetical protein